MQEIQERQAAEEQKMQAVNQEVQPEVLDQEDDQVVPVNEIV